MRHAIHVVLVIGGGILAGAALSMIPSLMTGEAQQHTLDPAGPATLMEWQQRAIAMRAFAQLDAKLSHVKESPPALRFTTTYEKIFVSVMHGADLRCCMSGTVSGTGDNRLTQDLDHAVERCTKDDRFGSPLRSDEADDVELVVSILYNRRAAVVGNPAVLEMQIERGVHALEIEREGRSTYFIPSVPITKNYSLKETLKQLCLKADLEDGCHEQSDVRLNIHDAVTFRAKRDGTIIPLYRYNPPLPLAAITPRLIEERLLLAEGWYGANVGEDGLLEYEYFPSSDRYSDDDHFVRQTASLWAMAALERFLQHDALVPLIERTVRHYRDREVCERDACRIELDGKSTLAYNAFLLLTLTDLPDTPESIEWRGQLARGIIAEQREDGSYRTIHGSDEVSNVDYYPGEAMLALMRLHQLTEEEAYLDSVRKAFSFYRDYWRGNRNTAFIPWHAQADYLLYQATKDPEIASFIFEINDWLIDNHQIIASPYPDLLGAFTRANPGPATFVYLEGLNDAYRLAQEMGDTSHAERYKTAIHWATAFMLTAQYTPENAFYLKNPGRAIGGFRGSLTNNVQRIDHTQHAVMALLKERGNGVFAP